MTFKDTGNYVMIFIFNRNYILNAYICHENDMSKSECGASTSGFAHIYSVGAFTDILMLSMQSFS